MLLIVIKFPAVPETVKVVTVVVVAAVNKIECAAEPSSLKSVKVLLSAIVFEAVLAPRDHQILLKVSPPPEKVLAVVDVSVILIVEVSWPSVSPVIVAVVQTVPVPDSVQVPLPIVITLVFELLEENFPIEKFLLFASKVPLVRVTVLVAPTVR